MPEEPKNTSAGKTKHFTAARSCQEPHSKLAEAYHKFVHVIEGQTETTNTASILANLELLKLEVEKAFHGFSKATKKTLDKLSELEKRKLTLAQAAFSENPEKYLDLTESSETTKTSSLSSR